MSNFKSIFVKIAAFLLSLVAAISCLIPALASDEPLGDYNFARPSSKNNITVSGEEILSDYLGVDLSSAESEYLRLHAGVNLTYDATITTAYVLTELVGDTLHLTLRPYSYLAENGVRVNWLPKSLKFNGDDFPITHSGTSYTARIEGVTDDVDHTLDVEYAAEFVISESDIESLLNQAYRDAEYYIEEIPRRIAESEQLIKDYDAVLISHEEYLLAYSEYESKYAVYTEYLREKKIYDERLEDYNTYLEDLALYHAAVENNKNLDALWESYYVNYALYLEYLDDVAEYEAALVKYGEYTARVERLQAQLSALEAAAKPMTDGRVVYNAIMGDMVSKVLANKDLIAGSLIGAAEEVVDSAGIATANLRILLQHYFSLLTFEERYSYYTVNYQAFRDNFIMLLRSLDNLYRNAKVRGYLISQGMDRKYIILVAQLAYISNALSDTTIYSYYKEYTYGSSFRIENQSIEQILEYKEYLIDTGNAAPDPDGYPQAMDEPQPPTVVEEPQKPEKLEIPTYPDEVAHPGEAPTVVDEPIKPTLCEHPGVRPTVYVPPIEISELVAAYKRGELARREGAETLIITKTQQISKKPFDPNKVTVSFFDVYGTLIEAIEIERGTVADFTGRLPTKREDASATYTFDSWQDGEGNSPDLSAVYTDLELYPSFIREPKYYDVTFRVGDTETTVSYPYGATVEFGEVPYLSHDNTFVYAFKSWDKPLATVTGSETYTAIFENTYILPFTNGGGASYTYSDGAITVDAYGSTGTTFDLAGIFEISHEYLGATILLNTRFGSVEIPYATQNEMTSDERTMLDIIVTQVSSYGYRYGISVKGEDGSLGKYKFTLTAPYGTLDGDGVFYRLDGEERQYVKNSKENGSISFGLTSGTVYHYTIERSIASVDSSLVSLGVSTGVARPGDTVYINYALLPGAILTRLYYRTESGIEEEIQSGRFTMPNEDVTVFATAKLKEIKITFKDGRQIIAVYTYKYGDTVTPPKDPMKLQDKIYTYTFVGWRVVGEDDPVAIGEATEDVTYIAVYDSEIIPKLPYDGSIKISPSILRLLRAAMIAVGLLVLVVIPSILALIIVKVKVRKMKKNK